MPSRKASDIDVAGRLAANIENPTDLHDVISTYFPTRQSYEFINQIAERAGTGGSALSLQGAYGAGKSSLSIFALHQLACRTKTFQPRRNIGSGPALNGSVKLIQRQGGMLAVPIVGATSSLSMRIVQGLRNYASAYIGRRPKALIDLLGTGKHSAAANDAALNTLRGLQEEITDSHPAGVLLLLDEFGRQFEHMIASGNLDDLHLLQNLAELPGNTGVPFTLAIIQHHGLEHYTNRFMSQQHAEWEKVQGRFHEFMLSNSETDTANIVAAILKKSKLASKRGPARKLPISHGSKAGKLLGKEFLATTQQCSMLHPMTIYLLSRLARLLGQGDRTVVGWLTSHLDSGFAAAAIKSGDWIYPDALFQHFFGDIQNLPSNPVIAKRFNAVHGAYSRLGVGSESDISQVLNTIGLLNFAHGGGLKADLDTIRSCLPPNANLPKIIRQLEEKSLIVFRRHLGEYKVWEGSDYDIQSRLKAIMQSTDYSPAGVLNERSSMRVLAHKHFLETGNHRTAELQWLDSMQPAPDFSAKLEPTILVWIDKASKGNHRTLSNCVWGVLDSKGINGYLQEVSALQSMLEHDIALQQDPVAQGEVKSQLAFLDAKIENRIMSALSSEVSWNVGTSQHSTLQQAVSEMMDRTYSKSVTLHNELINRQRVSGQVTSAARLLVEAMVGRQAMENLGISKFPAERIIYHSLLAEKKLHVKHNGIWGLTCDPQQVAGDILEILELVSSMGAAATSRRPCKVQDILAKLYMPPYGMKHMPASLVICVFLLVRKDEVELYEDNRYIPNWSDQTLVRMIKAPASFGMHIPESQYWPDKLLAAYRRVFSDARKDKGRNTPLNIARDALIRFAAISGYAKQTTALSKQALGVRRAFHTASSPADMLFVAIPKVFGFKKMPDAQKDQRQFFRSLKLVLTELEQADMDLVGMFRTILLSEFASKQLADARREMARQATLLLNESRMYHEHEAFLRLVVDPSQDQDEQWFLSLLDKGLDIVTPIREWSDDEASKAEFTFRIKILGLRQAAAALKGGFEQHYGRMPFVVWSNSDSGTGSVELSKLKKRLADLPNENLVPLLVELLRQLGAKK